MKRIILCLIICLPIFLQSCGKERIILKYKPTKLTVKEKARLTNEVKVVEVVDKRLYQNNVIGTTLTGLEDKQTPVILQQPIEDFVKDGLNRYMTDSILADDFTPIKVEIHNFDATVEASLVGYVPHTKYSFLFSFVKDNQARSFHLNDSSFVNLGAFNTTYSKILDKGFSRAAELFLLYYNNAQKTELADDFSAVSNIDKSISFTNSNIDTLDYKVHAPESSVWLVLQQFSGENSHDSYRVALEQVFRNKRNNWGYGYDTFFEIVNTKIDSERLFLYGLGTFVRYNLDPIYFSLSVTSIFGSEPSGERVNFFFGIKSTQQIGIELFNALRIGAGFYGVGIVESFTYPHDYGWLFTLGLAF